MNHPALIIRDARVHPSVAGGRRVEAVAVDHGGRISAAGATDEIAGLAGPGTEYVSAGGAALLPGFQDAHVHPVGAGIEMSRVNLTSLEGLDAYRAEIDRYCRAHSELDWITGGGWSMDAFEHGVPDATHLDGLGGGRPIYLPNRDHHSAWVNSVALERAGVDRNTPDPPDGRIERDADGNPTGALHEGAMTLVARLVPAPSRDDIRAGLLRAQAHLHSLGVTGWQDALVGSALGMPDCLDAYIHLAGAGELTASVVGALWWDRDRGAEQIDQLLERRSCAEGLDRFRASSVKIMQDGVCETFTAAMLEPYHGVTGHPSGGSGTSFIDADALCHYVSRLDALSFQVHFHALGDRAVRESLDAVAAARAANGPDGGRHHLAHLQVVQPEDIARFAELGATANAQPLWACNDRQMVELTLPYLGPRRSALQYPWGSLTAAGARLAIGSDWPVSSPDPRELLYVASTRNVPRDQRYGDWPGVDEPFYPHECITMVQAVRAYTMGTAFVNGTEQRTGSIEIGKQADLVVLSVDPFTAPPEDLLDAEVQLTVSAGRIVHRTV